MLAPAGMAWLPLAAAFAVGVGMTLAPLQPAARGLLTAGLMTLAYGATAWWAGPDWLRQAVWHEFGPARRGRDRQVR